MPAPMRPFPRIVLSLTCVLLLLPSGCAFQTQQRDLHEPDDLATLHWLDGRSPWLKAHLPDGDLYLLSTWHVDEDRYMIHGQGTHLNARRDTLAAGAFSVPLDSITVFESNIVQSSSLVAGLTVLTVGTVAMAAFCFANPKACFGSCPTFYAPDETGRPVLQAEGFSASVSPTLEGRDLDALYRTSAKGRTFTLRMTNEALETHVVRHADLLVAPRPPGGRVLEAGDGTWWRADELRPAARCTGAEGDCTALLAYFDDCERHSLADSVYLGAREVLELEFDSLPDGPLGLVIASRHSLLSTYLFYQGLAYLGENAVPALVRAGHPSGTLSGSKSLGDLLGRIEIQVPDSSDADGWRTVATAGETGPLAVNVHMRRLPELDPADPRLRLKLTKGNWRLDYVALAALAGEVTPVRVAPTSVLRDGADDPEALADLTIDDRTLISMPGDTFDLVYHLPDGIDDGELFLECGGYYLEWMRTEWLAEEDPAMAALMFRYPRQALRYLAPAFKALEPDMEAQFWGSRYARH